jgi:drug/metabolite transporter (DMT)-like permease
MSNARQAKAYRTTINQVTLRRDSAIAPHLALIAVQILFGTWPIFGKVVLRSMSTTNLMFCRLFGAAVVLGLIQRRLRPLWSMSKRDFVMLVLCSVLGVVGNQFIYLTGLSKTTVINTTLLSTTIPVFTLFVSILLGLDRLTLRRLVGIALAASGVIYLVNPNNADLSANTTVGNLLVVTSSFLYAAYIVISKDIFERFGALNVITWIFVVGAVMTLPMGIYSLQSANLNQIPLTIWLMIIFIILFPTVGAYYLNAWALTKVSPGTVAVYIYMQPLFASAVTPLLFGEKWGWRTVIAAGLIFAGVAVVTRRGRSSAVREISEHPDALAH